MKNNRICELFGIEKPIVQGGMVWCSGWRLAAAVSNAGGLGLLGAGSMHPETLMEHIRKMKQATRKPWGINVPLMYPEIDRLMDIIIEEGVRIVFTSAGSPKKYTARLHEAGIKVAHVVSSSLFARKCEDAGVDAIVAEGFEAGGLGWSRLGSISMILSLTALDGAISSIELSAKSASSPRPRPPFFAAIKIHPFGDYLPLLRRNSSAKSLYAEVPFEALS